MAPHSVSGEGRDRQETRSEAPLGLDRWLRMDGLLRIRRAIGEFLIQYLQFAVVGLMNTIVDLGGLNVLLAIWPTKDNLTGLPHVGAKGDELFEVRARGCSVVGCA